MYSGEQSAGCPHYEHKKYSKDKNSTFQGLCQGKIWVFCTSQSKTSILSLYPVFFYYVFPHVYSQAWAVPQNDHTVGIRDQPMKDLLEMVTNYWTA